jgi:hypothetical protein
MQSKTHLVSNGELGRFLRLVEDSTGCVCGVDVVGVVLNIDLYFKSAAGFNLRCR